MITELSLTGFKAWSALPPTRFAPLTGLFGVNSAGKSSIIQFLLMLKQTTTSADRQQVVNLGGGNSLVDLGSYADVVYAHETKSQLSWSLQFDVSPPIPANEALTQEVSELTFRATIGENPKVRQSLSLQDLEYEAIGHRFRLETGGKGTGSTLTATPDDFTFERQQGRPDSQEISFKCYRVPAQIRNNYKNADFLQDFELAVENLFQSVYYLGPLRDFPRREYGWNGSRPEDVGARGERVFEALLAARRDGNYLSPGRGRGAKKQGLEEYVAHWLKELGLVSSFRMEDLGTNTSLYRVLVRRSAGEPEVALTDVGFGVSQVLPVITLCYYVPEGATVIFEHPEIHLHPSVQSGLADMLLDAIKRRKIQILVESHSEHLLRRFQRRIAEEKVKADDCSLYFCDTQEGKARLQPLDLDEYGNIRNWPANFFGDRFGEVAAIDIAAFGRMEKHK